MPETRFVFNEKELTLYKGLCKTYGFLTGYEEDDMKNALAAITLTLQYFEDNARETLEEV